MIARVDEKLSPDQPAGPLAPSAPQRGRDWRLHAEAEPAPGEAPPLLRTRAGDMLPAELLQPGEIIVLLIKPSPWSIVLASLGSLAVIALVLAAGHWLYNLGYLHINRRDLILLAVGAASIRLFWQFLEWLSRVYVLTDRRVVRVKGVLRVQVFEAPLSKIQHTSTHFSVRERMFSLGTIAFATAGTGAVEAAWEMIARPLEVHRTVVETLNRYR